MTTTTTNTKPEFNAPTPPTLAPTDQATLKVAQRLTELCATGKGHDAIIELYADNAKHIEVFEMPGCPRVTEGKKALLEKSEKFMKSMTVHAMSCGKPLVNGEQFVCDMMLDATASEGPMANQRMKMTETCLYTVKNGKITEAKFFYGGC